LAVCLTREASWPNFGQELPEQDCPQVLINTLSADARSILSQLECYWPRHTLTDAFGSESAAETGKEAASGSTKGGSAGRRRLGSRQGRPP